jgi:hypothetical protein
LLASSPAACPSEAGQRGDHPDAEPGAQLEHAAGVAQRLDDRPHVVAAYPVLRDEVAEHPLVGVFGRAVEGGHGTRAEIREVAPRRLHSGRLVRDEQIHHPVRYLH